MGRQRHSPIKISVPFKLRGNFLVHLMFTLSFIFAPIQRVQSNDETSAEELSKNEVRIVSLHPSLTENLFALGLGDKVVGTTAYSDYPELAKKIPRIGDHNFSIEKIISLRPTHILSISDRFALSDDLAAKLKIKKIRIPLEKIDDFVPAIQLLAKTFSATDTRHSATIIQQWTSAWDKLKYSEKNESVLIQVQLNPIVAVGSNTFLNTILKTCGLRNAIDGKNGYPILNREFLMLLNLQHVVLLLTDMDAAMKQSAQNLWAKIPRLSYFEPEAISRITPRLPLETKHFCEAVR